MITVNKNDDLNKALSDAEDFLRELEARRGERENEKTKTLRKKLLIRKAEGQITNKINCCPKCGGTIEISYLYQYSHNYLLGKRGKILKKYRSQDHGSTEEALACCTNKGCDTKWEVGDFIIDEFGYFVDLKYTERECDL